MKLNQSLTAGITAAALVAGAGFAYAQSTATQGGSTPGASPAQGSMTQNQGPGTPGAADNSTMQAQPSTGMGSSANTSVDTTLEPRADRN